MSLQNYVPRIGHGYDVHRLVPDRPLILGGVHIPFALGLQGHSDADVLTHAIMDALLGASGLPDIGRLFPPGDPETRNISSLLLLGRVMQAVDVQGYVLGNLDATVIAEAPPLSPHYAAMRDTLAKTMNVPLLSVTLKATTEEGLGFTGHGEGIAAHAVCLLLPKLDPL